MLDLSALREQVLIRLDAKHRARETTLRASRASIRCSSEAIRAAHRGDTDLAAERVEESREQLHAARAACADHPEIAHAGYHDAQKEYAEAQTTCALIAGAALPQPEALGVSDAAYLNGLAETVGELRRFLLDQLRQERLDRCESVLEAMEDIYGLLVTIDFPDGVTSGLRRSTDVARSIIERTRGDLTNALVQRRLQVALDDHRRQVLGA